MKYRLLGRTGVLVSELCLGSNTFGGAGDPMWEPIGGLDQRAASAMVARAIEHGINFFDTANLYAAGEAEQRLGRAIAESGIPRHDLVIATKAGFRMGAGVNALGGSRAHLIAALDDSLRRLGIDYVDVFMMHQFDRLTPLEETMRALDDLVRAGKVRYLGCSNFAAWQLALALGISAREMRARFEVTESYYSVAVRDIEREIAPLLLHQGVGLMVWGALLGGILTGKYARDGALPQGTRFSGGVWMPHDQVRTFDTVDAMRRIAGDRGVPVGRIALAWLLARNFVTSVIFGARTLAQLDENVAASGLVLTAEELAMLDRISALSPEYPGWKLAEAYADRPTPDFTPPQAALAVG